MAGKVGLLESTGKGAATYNFSGILPEGLAPVPIPGYFGLSRGIACGLRLDLEKHTQIEKRSCFSWTQHLLPSGNGLDGFRATRVLQYIFRSYNMAISIL